MTENSKQTIIAFVRLACMFAASGAAMTGFALDANALFDIASVVVAAGFGLWAWWKNNNVTKAATEAQELLDIAKSLDVYRDVEKDVEIETSEIEDAIAEIEEAEAIVDEIEESENSVG